MSIALVGLGQRAKRVIEKGNEERQSHKDSGGFGAGYTKINYV